MGFEDIQWRIADRIPLVSEAASRYLIAGFEKRRPAGDGIEAAFIDRISRSARRPVSGPNVDTWRFPHGFPWWKSYRLLKTMEYVHENAVRLDWARDQLRDQKSRDLFLEVLVFRALGPEYAKFSTNNDAFWRAYSDAASAKRSSAGDYGGFEVGVFDTSFDSSRLKVKCWLGNVVATVLLKQYFLQEDDARVEPSTGDVVLDIGACFGDTAMVFALAVGESGRVFSFEPMPNHLAIFKENLAANPQVAPQITFVPRAVSAASDEIIHFTQAGGGSRSDKQGSLEVTTISIDDFVAKQKLDRVNFIKMDIEGAELSALKGAAQTIRQFQPKLAISIYHRPNDLFEIMEVIHDLNPAYQFHLGHYAIQDEEIILYAKA